jgi:hypothetical protein
MTLYGTSKGGIQLGGQYNCYSFGYVLADNYGNGYLRGGATYEQGFSGCSNSSNAITVLGHTLIAQQSDFLITKLGNATNLALLKQSDGEASEYINDMFVSKNGDCYVTGGLNSIRTHFGTDSIVTSGQVTYFTAKLGSSNVSIKENSVFKRNPGIFPNPSKGVIYTNSETVKSIKLFNLLGTKILETCSNTLDIGNESSGVYIIEINDATGRYLNKIILE